jgi:hypothetical protein
MNTTMLRIEAEKRLEGETTATIDEAGNCCIIQNDSLPESEQVWVSLSSQAVRALRNMLNSQKVQDLINE